VGNWKAILKDPDLKFDSRSPVDLKDRFVPHLVQTLSIILEDRPLDKFDFGQTQILSLHKL
jgi:hypothetical protein